MNKFYTFDQNNSGGYFIKCAKMGISEFVILEARDSEHAQEIFNHIGEQIENFYCYCSCCGHRWENIEESDGSETPMVYDSTTTREEKLPDQLALDKKPYFKHAFVHPMNGPFYSAMVNK